MDAAAQSSQRRSQPVRQARTNPPRNSASLARPSAGRESLSAGPAGDQPIDIFPAITHFADAMTAVPKELVRHFTLLKEVDAKIYAPEEQLFKLIETAASFPVPDPRQNVDMRNSMAPTSAPMSAQNSLSGIPTLLAAPSQLSVDDSNYAPSSIQHDTDVARRQHFREICYKIRDMLVALEEKNHVISTANDALQRQLARVEDVWPYVEGEFSDEAKWGSVTHWAYPENRTGKSAQAERARRDGAAAISAAAQALADEAAARSDARKQAVQAKKNLKNQFQDAELDDQNGQHKESGKKSNQSKVRKTAEGNGVGLGITSGSATNGNPPQKRRKVEKLTNGGAPMERAMSSVFGNSAPKAKASSPRATPAPEGPKKRKALPSGSGQAKKKNGASGISSSAASSPVLTTLPDPKMPSRVSPTPTSVPRPASSRARQNSIQSNNMETGRSRPASAAPSKPNGSTPVTSDVPVPTISQRPNIEVKSVKESSAPARTETVKTEVEKSESSAAPTPVVAATAKKDKDKEKEKENEQDADKDNENDAKAEEAEKKSESAPPAVPVTTTVTTKSGRASKPSTPALATFQEAARPRSSRNTESTGGSKKGHRKSSSVAQIILPPPTEGVATSTLPGDVEDEDGDIDADEPTYCYCNSVSYGEMVACDADGCPREWFHLACVGLRVAPGSKSKMPSTFAVIVSSRLTWRALQRNGTAKTAKNG
jgi:hypothetical protein